MIFYNWKLIYAKSNKSSRKILQIIRYLTFKPIPTWIGDPYQAISEINWRGDSYLLHPEEMFYNRRKHEELHLAQYVGLASMRNYAEYKLFGVKTLDLLACEGKEALINQNSLLYVEDDRVHFLYEEAP